MELLSRFQSLTAFCACSSSRARPGVSDTDDVSSVADHSTHCALTAHTTHEGTRACTHRLPVSRRRCARTNCKSTSQHRPVHARARVRMNAWACARTSVPTHINGTCRPRSSPEIADRAAHTPSCAMPATLGMIFPACARDTHSTRNWAAELQVVILRLLRDSRLHSVMTMANR